MRVAIVGLGAVGEACAHVLAGTPGITGLVLANRTVGIANGVRLDLEQSRAWGPPLRARACTPWAADAFVGCDVIVLTAGPRLRGQQTRADKAVESRNLLRGSDGESIAEALIRHLRAEDERRVDARSVLLVVTNPVEALVTWLADETGWDRRRIVGLGTTVETARFSLMLADKLDVDASSVWTEIIGEHGSNIDVRDRNALETRATQVRPRRSVSIDELIQRTRDAAGRIREESEQAGAEKARRLLAKLDATLGASALAGELRRRLEAELASSLTPPATRFAIAAAVAEVVAAVRDDRKRVLPVSGFTGLPGLDDVAVAAPFAVARAGLLECATKSSLPILDKAADEIRDQVAAMKA